MPISRREFEDGSIGLSWLVLEFLRSNPDLAYTIEELIAEMTSRGADLTPEECRDILDTLERRGRVELKEIDKVIYYTYSRAMGFRPSAR